MRNVLKKYNPPKGSLNYIVNYSLIVRSIKHILPRASNFDDLDNFKSDDEIREVILEYILDDKTVIQKLIGRIDEFGFAEDKYCLKKFKTGRDWKLYVTNTNMRKLASKGIYVNNYSHAVEIKDYLKYRLSNKLTDFLL